MKKNKVTQLIIAAIMLVAGIAISIYGYLQRADESYAHLKELGKNKGIDMLYAIGLVIVIIGIVSLISTLVTKANEDKTPVIVLAQAALLAALCFVGAGYLKIDIPVGTEKTMFHLGNVFCVLAALLIGGKWGGLAGAVGMTLSDLMTGYITSAPKTFLLKFCIGLIVGLVAHKIFKITKEGFDAKKLPLAVVVSCVAGMGFNVVADPIVGYFYKTYLLGVPQDLAKALAKINSITTLVNAIIAVVVASVLYLALRPALRKAGLFHQIGNKNKLAKSI